MHIPYLWAVINPVYIIPSVPVLFEIPFVKYYISVIPYNFDDIATPERKKKYNKV